MSAYTSIKAGQGWTFSGPHDGLKFKLLVPLTWHIGRKDSRISYTVLPEVWFDVSVPWWACWLIDPCDVRFLKAACLHDHMLLDGWDRTTAAGIFNDALRADGVSKAKRLVMFLAVAAYKWS